MTLLLNYVRSATRGWKRWLDSQLYVRVSGILAKIVLPANISHALF
jgi:hypothetical protein